MSNLKQRGFTFLELLIALLLASIVGLAIYKVLVGNQRVFRAQAQQMDLQQNLRLATGIFSGEFRELNASEGDIQAMSANSIRIRSIRRLGFLCSPPVLGGVLTGLTATVRKVPAFGTPTSFSAGDSVFMFYEGNAVSRTDDGWQAARVTAVADVNCPAPDNAAGQRLTMDIAAFVAPKVNVAGGITAGAPIRGFEVVTYSAAQGSDSKWYVNVQTSAGTQPIIGPIVGSTGLSFSYFDAAGAVTAVPANVASILVTLRAEMAEKVASGGSAGLLVAKVDSIGTRVALRNNPRF